MDICRGTLTAAAGCGRRPRASSASSSIACTAADSGSCQPVCSGRDGPADRALRACGWARPGSTSRDRAARRPGRSRAPAAARRPGAPGTSSARPASPRPDRARRRTAGPRTPVCRRTAPSTRRPTAAGTSSTSNVPPVASSTVYGRRRHQRATRHGSVLAVVLPGLEGRVAAHDRAAGPAAGEAVTGQTGARRHGPAVRGVAQGGAAQSHPIHERPWADRPIGCSTAWSETPDLGTGRRYSRRDCRHQARHAVVCSGRSRLCNLHEKLRASVSRRSHTLCDPHRRSEVHTAADTPKCSPAGVAG